ncbi:expressed unknown protein [Seminavis robusta]|uniref:Plastid lipid-associated protein/fibrillin conserved domain-containing protein n=1 Tax=Seminavis robusta TaxID=568900 RepID=A0A9N8ES33_9STRA|nr:expressed unknown protein [Seminavis robusta]CAB9524084.1 expressed unknown protein [Seminavis robusta]|eukprot:Sro1091_g240270.1 n/a (278) ;mRNA; r:18624-19579
MKVSSGATAFLLVALAQLCLGFVSKATPSPVCASRNRCSSLSVASTPLELQEKFAKIKPALPADLDVVSAGGWYNLQKTYAQESPKDALVQLIVEGLVDGNKKVEFAAKEERLNALLILLYAMGKGFEADVVNGEWSLVFSKQGKKSPRIQKAVGKKERAGQSSVVYDIQSMTFSGGATILKKGKVASTVKYNPLSQGYSKTVDHKIVIRRIGCDIIGASWKFWFLPKIPLPLRAKGGYLEFIYMDSDIQITKGNRGGLAIHFRPEYLEKKLAAYSA